MRPAFECLRPLILASSSPRRQDFLRAMDLVFQTFPVHSPEARPEAGEAPTDYALRAALQKALDARSTISVKAQENSVILAADTIVTLDRTILGKPDSEEEALIMLRRLSGRTHTVITACCLLSAHVADSARKNTPCCFADKAHVTFASWPEVVLRAYIATGDPMDKAGAYGIQGRGAFLVEKLEGSWSTVVGLPVNRVLTALLEHGVVRPTVRLC